MRWAAPGWKTRELMPPWPMALRGSSGVIDISGQWIEPPRAPAGSDNDNPSMRWAWRDNLWGLQRPDGSWLVEPKFQQADRLLGELTRVMLNGKVGFIDREGRLTIEPVFDEAWPFGYVSDRTAAVRDGAFGVIDKAGAWSSQWASCKFLSR
jgi:WG containing repeat